MKLAACSLLFSAFLGCSSSGQSKSEILNEVILEKYIVDTMPKEMFKWGTSSGGGSEFHHFDFEYEITDPLLVPRADVIAGKIASMIEKLDTGWNHWGSGGNEYSGSSSIGSKIREITVNVVIGKHPKRDAAICRIFFYEFIR